MDHDLDNIFSNDKQDIFSDNMDIFDIYNLNGDFFNFKILDDKTSDNLIFPSSLTGDKENQGLKDLKNEKNKTNNVENEKSGKEEPGEDKKPKINVLSMEEMKNYYGEVQKNEHLEAFMKEFKRCGFKKKQPDGVLWNEITKKFEKSPDLLEIEKELRMLENDKDLEIKNFHAKNLDKEISERIKKNPEKAKEILNEYGVKKVDPKEALKDFNKEMSKEILEKSISTNRKAKEHTNVGAQNDKHKKARNDQHSSRKDSNASNHRKDFNHKKDNWKSNRGRRHDGKDRRNLDLTNNKRRNDSRSRSEIRSYNQSDRHDTNHNRTHICKDSDYFKSSKKSNNSKSPSHIRRDRDHNSRSKSTNSRDISIEIRSRSNDKIYDNVNKKEKSRDRKDSTLDRSMLSDISNNARDDRIYNTNKNYQKPIDTINIVTPQHNYHKASKHFDLTNDELICYMPGESDQMKRKKLHEEMKDVVVNVKVDNINYILNNHNNTGHTEIQMSLDEFTSKLLKDLKLVLNQNHSSQMIDCINYVENQLNVDNMNVYPEYMSFRDKFTGLEKEVLMNSLFYYMFVFKSIVKSSKKRKTELKILQENSLIMRSDSGWPDKSLGNNKIDMNTFNKSNIGRSNENFTRDLRNFNGEHHLKNNKSQNTNNDNYVRKSPNYMPQILDLEDEDVIMNGDFPNNFNNKPMDSATLIFGDFEKTNKDKNRDKIDHKTRPQIEERSRSKSPLVTDRHREKTLNDLEEKRIRGKSADISRSPVRSVTDLTRQINPKETINLENNKMRDSSKMNSKNIHQNEKFLVNVLIPDVENNTGADKERELRREKSKSPLRIIDDYTYETKKDFLNKKRKNSDRDEYDLSILNEKDFNKSKNKISDSNLPKNRNDQKSKKTEKKKEDKNENLNSSKTAKTEKKYKRSEIEAKIKDLCERDEKYNLIMKYANKITDPENFRNLSTLIPKENSEMIEKASSGKIKGKICVDLYEHELFNLIALFDSNTNKFRIVKKFNLK